MLPTSRARRGCSASKRGRRDDAVASWQRERTIPASSPLTRLRSNAVTPKSPSVFRQAARERLALQGSGWYHAVHGTRFSATNGAAPRCARSLPAGGDGRGAGIRLRDDQAAARPRPCDRWRGLHLPVAGTFGARRPGRDLPGREQWWAAAKVLPPLERRAARHSRWACRNGELPAMPSMRCSLPSRSRWFHE